MRAVAPPGAPVAVRAGVDGTVGVALRRLEDRRVVLARTASDRRRGALARRDGESLAAAARMALDLRVPLVLELATSGADILDGVDALHGWGAAAAAVAACSGVVPVVAAVFGPALSGPAFLLGLADLVTMTPEVIAYVSGPSMVAAFTGVRLEPAALGGTGVHALSSGLCALETDDPLDTAAELLSYLPDHTDAETPPVATDDPGDRRAPELRAVVPASDHAAYDVRDVVTAIADDRIACELWPRWAPQLVTAFARIEGRAVGVVANQPRSLAGTLDIVASQKGARFVRLCDAFNLPIITLVDTPGFLPGKDLEWRGMIRHGAELVLAYAEATVPRLCVILRKAFGGAYIVMDSQGLGNDLCLAWPSAEVAVMGASAAVQILHRRTTDDDRRRREVEYGERFLTPWPAAERGFVDAVIDPADTRFFLAGALRGLASKREALAPRKHDGGPL